MTENNPKDETGYYDILLSDIQLHNTLPRKPLPWYRAIIKSFRNKKPGRFYTKDFSVEKTNETSKFRLSIPLSKEIEEKVEEANKLGKKIRIITPENGIPIYLGKDTIEFLKSKQGKRLTNKFWKR